MVWHRDLVLDFRSRVPGFDSSRCCFEAWAILFTPHCFSSLSYINECLATDTGGYVKE